MILFKTTRTFMAMHEYWAKANGYYLPKQMTPAVMARYKIMFKNGNNAQDSFATAVMTTMDSVPLGQRSDVLSETKAFAAYCISVGTPLSDVALDTIDTVEELLAKMVLDSSAG